MRVCILDFLLIKGYGVEDGRSSTQQTPMVLVTGQTEQNFHQRMNSLDGVSSRLILCQCHETSPFTYSTPQLGLISNSFNWDLYFTIVSTSNEIHCSFFSNGDLKREARSQLCG